MPCRGLPPGSGPTGLGSPAMHHLLPGQNSSPCRALCHRWAGWCLVPRLCAICCAVWGRHLDTVIQKGDGVALAVQNQLSILQSPRHSLSMWQPWPPSCLWTPSSALTFLSSSVSWRHSKPQIQGSTWPKRDQPGAMLRWWPPCLGNRPPSLTGICILSIQACSLVAGVRGWESAQSSICSALLPLRTTGQGTGVEVSGCGGWAKGKWCRKGLWAGWLSLYHGLPPNMGAGECINRRIKWKHLGKKC